MRLWISIFTLAIFAGGACLGVALDRKVLPQPQTQVQPAPSAATSWPSFGGWGGWHTSPHLSVSRFSDKLALSSEQERELDFIFELAHRENDLHGRAMREAHDRSRDKVMSIITEDQKKRLDELLAEERRARAEAEIARSVKFYSRFLELSEEQSEKVRGVLSDLRNKRRAAFGEKRDRSQFVAFFKGLREEQNRRMGEILTPEQYSRYLLHEEFDH